ncbi:MAG: tRNA 2-thiouridine(34) synthase MnmA [Bacilli bacterium]|nr:tRNA 2-thiouridine(34) synthase MnmA [Bacilli bacterium]MDY4052284.1 tRNA 2-thiouridine(34) synthase MnmA [Bacilli bacterium]
MPNKPKVIIGLSGGVDSSVGIIKLQEAGYDVEAMFMRNWDSAVNNDILGNPDLMDEVCPQEKDYMDAKRVAEQLGVKLYRIDFIEEYWNEVFTYFLEEYKRNRTPNPDILCNKEIKFKAFLKKAEEMGADYIAMGHYARVIHDGDKHYLLRGVDSNKDQTYFLSQLTSAQLSKALFPVGELTKPEVRKIATEHNLVVATKKDSTGICFIGERNFKEFLKNYLPAQPGNMVTSDGTVVGTHEGIMYYTIGQRHGLGIGGPGEAWFVIGKNPQKNELIVGQGDEQELLFANRAIIKDINIINGPLVNTDTLSAKFRYRAPDVKVKIKYLDDNTIEVITSEPVKAITPGQACVFYDGEYCLGGGTIDEVYMDDVKRRY